MSSSVIPPVCNREGDTGNWQCLLVTSMGMNILQGPLQCHVANDDDEDELGRKLFKYKYNEKFYVSRET